MKPKNTTQKKISLSSMSPWSHIVAIGSIAIFLASCGEDSTVENITQVNQSGIEVISDVSKLPNGKKDNDGEMVWVKGEYAH